MTTREQRRKANYRAALAGCIYDVSALPENIQIQIGESLWSGAPMWTEFPSQLLAVGKDAKTVKGEKVVTQHAGYVQIYRTAIMYLAPADMSGVNHCALAELAMCKDPCLNTAGRGRFDSVQLARLRKTLYFNQYRSHFMAQLMDEIAKLRAQCIVEQHKYDSPTRIQLCVRLNGTSDIMWEKQDVYVKGHSEGMNGEKIDPTSPYWLGGNLMEYFPDVQFYDYTKIAKRGPRPLPNYDLTFSNSGANPKEYEPHLKHARDMGFRFATVVRDEDTKDDWMLRHDGGDSIPCYDGDEHDLTFLRPQGSNLLLTAKGKGKTDTSGFVFG